jgi:alkylation response protein AidB-like acyl-CoA dehydrogenase
VDFSLTPEDEAFRDELRAWIDRNLAEFNAEFGVDESDAILEGIARTMVRRKSWQRRLNEGRWAAINWPSEWGGRDATPMQSAIYSEENARARTPGIYNANGLWQIGPMIIKWGTDEQKRRWLHEIINADTHWCQGFSEPQAGSDLANLRTTAVPDGDHYILNGQKTWCSTAHLADWGLFLVRTDPTAIERDAKHEGITALIVDMHLPGIEARPITDIAGEDMFCDVFFTDARVPVAYRLGEEGHGWQVAMGTLGHERVGTAGLAIAMKADLERMIEMTRKHNPEALKDPVLRDRIARAHTQIELSRLLTYRALSKVLKGEKTWPEVQIGKLQWSEVAQQLAELAVDMLGPAGALARGGPDAVDGGRWNRLFVFQRYTTIGAGTTEVQKNIIAERAIQLPRR